MPTPRNPSRRPAEEEAEPGAEEAAPEEGEAPPEEEQVVAGTVVTQAPNFARQAEGEEDEEVTSTDPGAVPNSASTVIYNTGAKKASAPSGKLVVLKGIKKGAEFSLGPGESSIGRQNDNTIVVPDISVSRKHVVLRKQGRGYVCVDQGSGNGTLVNGQPIDEQELHNGDVIGIGDTELQYVELGGVAVKGQPTRSNTAMPARQSQRRSAPVAVRNDFAPDATNEMVLPRGGRGAAKKGGGPKIIIALVLVVMVVGGGALTFLKMKQDARSEAQEKRSAAEQEKVMGEVSQLKDEGRKLAGQKHWDLALEPFRKAAELAPDDEELADYIKNATTYGPACAAFQDVQKALGEGDLGKAAEAMAKVGDKIPPNLVDDVEAVKKQLKDGAVKAVTDAKAALAAKDVLAAAKAIKTVTLADPQNPDLASLNEEYGKLTNAPVDKGHPKVTTTVKAVDVVEKARETFRAGDVDGAIALAKSEPKGANLAAELQSFKSVYADLEAPGNLEKALKSAKQIGGAGCKYATEIGGKAASIYYRQGLAAMTADNKGKAYALFRKCLDANPSHKEAKQQLNELCNSAAKETFLAGYVQKQSDPDVAKKKFEQVINMTGPDCEYYEKAKRQLKDMGVGDD